MQGQCFVITQERVARAERVVAKALSVDLFLILSPSLAVGLKIGSCKRRGGTLRWQEPAFYLRKSPFQVRLRYLFSISHSESRADHPI